MTGISASQQPRKFNSTQQVIHTTMINQNSADFNFLEAHLLVADGQNRWRHGKMREKRKFVKKNKTIKDGGISPLTI